MASDLQNTLYRTNKQFVYLSELMAQQIYPRLIEALRKLGMEEVRFSKINHWKDFCITLDGKLQFFVLDKEGKEKTDIYTLRISGKKDCPLFLEDGNNKITKFNSPFPLYKVYCETVIEKMEDLEQNFIDAENLITRIENMGVSLNRKVMFEKIDKNG
jgi:hypothetical protein